jgi:hypothetical protein
MNTKARTWEEWKLLLWRKWRLAVIWVSFRVPSWLEARLVAYLYPDDLLLEVATPLEVQA